MTKDILVPNIGDFKNIEIIEILIKEGQEIKKGDAVITLESDKSSVEVPSSLSGKVKKIHIKIGDKVSEGSLVASLEESSSKESKVEETSFKSLATNTNSEKIEPKELKSLIIPSIDFSGKLIVTDILVKEGDAVSIEQPIITLEDDNSSIDVPSPVAGIIYKILVKKKEEVSEQQEICKVEIGKKTSVQPIKQVISKVEENQNVSSLLSSNNSDISGSSPKVMKFARELGVSINEVEGSGRKGRVLEEDIKKYVNQNLNKNKATIQIQNSESKTTASEPLPYEHSEFGEIDIQNIPRIKRLSGPHLVKAWTSIPHVTQHDELNVTEMESFRKNLVDLNTREIISITPLAFMIKALVNGMKKFPNFNSSIDNDKIIFKKYFHIGIAVDTPHGLMVPKIRNVDKKNLSELSLEIRKISKLCKELKIDKKEFFGGSMTISSLGGIGGSFFTPIINAPEVAIIGIGKSEMKQIFIKGKFEPRLMMPISLSYDHRIIDGAEAAKFCQDLKISLGRNFAMKLAV
jgi:pyruvate dehydrogenase E2 component (dihydrolipoamide acetyltransferase)